MNLWELQKNRPIITSRSLKPTEIKETNSKSYFAGKEVENGTAEPCSVNKSNSSHLNSTSLPLCPPVGHESYHLADPISYQISPFNKRILSLLYYNHVLEDCYSLSDAVVPLLWSGLVWAGLFDHLAMNDRTRWTLLLDRETLQNTPHELTRRIIACFKLMVLIFLKCERLIQLCAIARTWKEQIEILQLL